jgi:hypothetical protein
VIVMVYWKLDSPLEQIAAGTPSHRAVSVMHPKHLEQVYCNKEHIKNPCASRWTSNRIYTAISLWAEFFVLPLVVHIVISELTVLSLVFDAVISCRLTACIRLPDSC